MTTFKKQLLINGIKTLLDVSPFYGFIIMNLNRLYDEEATNALQLKWQSFSWYLVVNPVLLEKQYGNNSNDVAVALAHEALHMFWQHPTRYAESNYKDQLIDMGTDIAVNQYLPINVKELPDFVTLQTISQIYNKVIPEKLDSESYIKIIADLENNDMSKNTPKSHAKHHSWQTAKGALGEAHAASEQLVKKAWKDSEFTARGTQVSAPIQKHIDQLMQPKKPWRSILKLGLSQMPNKKSDTHSRFNRRQPYRLELPGERYTNTSLLAIFMDNSASIGDERVAKIIDYVGQITKSLDAEVAIFNFDTMVKPVKYNHQNIRYSGGGTTFQSIFDYLVAQHYEPTKTAIVILTDGDGENEVINRNFHQVYWILPENKHLSLKKPFGKVITFDF
ncbi:vWA domain-containing protein [Leuconostoc palmae]|uniref:vWA domain-containing protein n=1 Tax=Leuconostoc palmae TaxID=501487 RepID=UPI001C7D7AEB|nr:VWA-like domain-containing protein [Leuconostoc palmae]